MRNTFRRLRGALGGACVALLLTACAQPWQAVPPGADASVLTARLGPPREVYDLPDGGKRLMWPTQPLGEFTTAADVDASGKVLNVRQVLDENEFYKAQIGVWTKKDVLVNFGRLVKASYFPLMKREVWTYRYMEANIWYMMYSFYFDDQGIVRLTQKTPDPLHDPERRNVF
ncbi:putative lipoprotein transmembrane [Candidatus Paraburkholderia calva]|nr:putative lipoprotein transmembrane [Candidatus Paraburkholderia calva]